VRFDKAYIDNIRETAGDEAAATLEQANSEEDHRDRVAKFKTDPSMATRFPRMAFALKSETLTLPTFTDDASAEAYMKQQEDFLTAMKAPLPGEDQNRQNQQQNTPNAGENQGDQNQPTPLTEDMLGRVPGVVPWDENATQAVLAPTAPGGASSQITVIIADLDALMDPKPGEFRRERERSFQLLKGIMVANSYVGGAQQLHRLSEQYMDPDVFPFS
jgi:hypothetical protein